MQQINLLFINNKNYEIYKTYIMQPCNEFEYVKPCLFPANDAIL